MAHIPDLENEARVAKVLAARLVAADDNAMYVVERVKSGIYSLSRLARYIGVGDVLVAMKGCDGSFEKDIGAGGVAAECGEWWEVARVADPESSPVSISRGKFDVSLAFQAGPLGADPPMNDGLPDASEDLHQSIASRVPPLERCSSSDVNLPTPLDSSQVSPDGAAGGDVSPQELLDSLRDQYLQALYISKVSVVHQYAVFIANWPDVPCLFRQRPVDALPHGFPVV